jgi:UDP:flavonoid glycosyltransferase YjiC (YdhE family)
LQRAVAVSEVRPRAKWRRRLESIPWFLMQELARWRLQRARRACSRCLPPDEIFRQTTIVAGSDASIEVGETFTPNVHLVGPLIPGDLPALPAPTQQWVDRHAATGIVLVALGTLVRLRERQLESLARGLADCGAGVLWALPEHQHALVLRHSASFRAETFVSQMTLLSRAPVRAFVSHAGANSAIEAMYWGRPVLGLPFMFDQHYYARRMVDLATGLQLEPHAFTSEDVREAIRRLLREPAFADAAQRLAARLQRTPGVKGAADIVEAELARQAGGA